MVQPSEIGGDKKCRKGLPTARHAHYTNIIKYEVYLCRSVGLYMI
jgi:hypothetical protein